MILMDQYELESKILANSAMWISKSGLFRKVGGNRNRCFRTIDDLAYNGTVDFKTVGNTDYVQRNLANSDDVTWNSVYDFIKNQFETASSEIIAFKGKHLFKGYNKKYHNRIQIQPKFFKSITTFCYAVDAIMQHIVILEYARIFAFAPLTKVERRQKRYKDLLKKQVNAVLSSLQNDFDKKQFRKMVQEIDRTWNLHV